MAAPAPAPPIVLVQLPDDNKFKLSYEKCETYPENLVCQTSYPSVLKGYISRLDEQDPKLFGKDKFEVPFRDYLEHGPDGGLKKQNIYNEEQLRAWLGDLRSAMPAGSSVTKKDPKCRFIFFWAADSREPLNLNKAMLLRILTYHQVMSDFLDFLSIFGEKDEKNEARDRRYSGFREQTTIAKSSRGYAVLSLGRSGQQFQLCYNLKSVVCKSASTVALVNKEWSIRQAAFHHQFDVQEGTTLWIVAQGRKGIKTRIQELTGKEGRTEDRDFSTPEGCFRSSLAVHLLYCHWSTEGWRWYVQWLEEVIEENTGNAILERRESGGNIYKYSPKDIQSVQYFEDRTNEAIMVMEANTNVLTSLRKYYQHLLRAKDFGLKKVCRADIVAFATQVDDMIYNSRMHIARAKVLAQITADRKGLILQHLQSQATEQQREATMEMERLTKSMHKIGMNAQKEQIGMRIITVVTLVFLPATFVSTFFSTDIVKYQNQQNSSPGDGTNTSNGPSMGSFSELAMLRWLEVTIPLTTLTLCIGYCAYHFYTRQATKKLANLGLLPVYENESKSNLTP